MATLPHSYTVRDILPSEKNSQMGRDGYQECELRRTSPRNKKRAKWFCRYAVDVITGPGQTKRIERRKYFGLCVEMTERDAKRQRDEFRRQVNAPVQATLESQVPVSNWLRTYEDTFIPTLKPNSRPGYVSGCRMIEARFGGLRLCDVNPMRIQGWLNELAPTRTRNTLARLLATLKSVLEVAADYGYVEADRRNPCERVRLPHAKASVAELRALTPDEIRRLLAVCDTMAAFPGVRMGDLARVALFCGLRIGEILALRWDDYRPPVLTVDESRCQQSGEMVEPKSASGVRSVALGPVRLERPAGAGAEDRIFACEQWTAYRTLKRALKVAGIQISGTAWHALRRTYATYMDAAGSTSLREQMGHASDEMTDHYIRRTVADQERASRRMAELVIGEGGRKQ